MARELVQTRADGDTVEALEEFAEESDITRSEAIRRLLRSGLAQQGHPVKAADGSGQLADRLEAIENRQAERKHVERLHTATLAVGLAYIVATLTLGLSGPIWFVTGVLAVVAVAAATYLMNQVSQDDE